MHTFSSILVAVMLSAGLAGAEEYETRTVTVREERSLQHIESSWAQTTCDEVSCTTTSTNAVSVNEVHTYFEQQQRWSGWRPRARR